MQKSDAKKGMKVTFGRSGPLAAKAVGIIEKCNPSRAKVRITEQFNSHSPGQVFNVAYEMMSQLSESCDEPKPKQSKIEVGKTMFRSTYADGNPIWKVIRKEGRNYRCEVQKERVEIGGRWYDGDWAGTQKIFSPEEIQATIGLSQLFEELNDQHRFFYDNLTPGQTIHYHNGFNDWVRCEVVVEDGENKLKPIALVGNWRSSELPRRTQDGSIVNGYYPDKILKGMAFKPNASHLFEAGCQPRNDYDDPSTLTPISLAVPEMDEAEAMSASLWKKVNEIQNLCGNNERNPQDIIDDIRILLE